ncbi:MAG TPA: prolyl oligopeptidase family serine peptidase, partial [Thermoanaerobaculia bacterium]|nr:prolyl oligopeptidase family serine peptidase [Thermoanaerobaculia bacterium]
MTKTRDTALHHTLALALVLAACGADTAVSSSASSPARTNGDLLKLFEYDPSAPLDPQVGSSEKKEGYTLQQLTYVSPKGGRVPALLLIPDGRGPFPGVLLLHGMPGSAEVMLPEAERLARSGAISLAITAPFARSHRIGVQQGLNFDEHDRDEQIQLIIDLRRGVDLLLSRPDVAKNRLGYVGISYGGALGGLLAGVETRIKAYALVVGDGGLVTHFTGPDDSNGFLKSLPPEQVKRWLAIMEPIEPMRWVGRAAPAHLLFQNGQSDTLVPPATGRAYQEAGSEPKKLLWYDADHGLNGEAVRDRHTWLAEQIGIRT